MKSILFTFAFAATLADHELHRVVEGGPERARAPAADQRPRAARQKDRSSDMASSRVRARSEVAAASSA